MQKRKYWMKGKKFSGDAESFIDWENEAKGISQKQDYTG
jgi:hypothetical protein